MKLLQGSLILVIGVLLGLVGQTLAESVQYPAGSALERISPQDRISEDDIEVYPDRVVINLEGAQWARFADTNSMDPIIDRGTNAIQIQPKSMDEIDVGDIISYRAGDRTIIHRVVQKSVDEQGWYVLAKGDNNPAADPEKVRFEQISRVLVAVIY